MAAIPLHLLPSLPSSLPPKYPRRHHHHSHRNRHNCHNHRHSLSSLKATTSSLSLIPPKSTTPNSISTLQPLFNSTNSNPKPDQTQQPLHSSHPNEDPNPLSTHYHHFLSLSVLQNDILIAKTIHASMLKSKENTQLSNTLITTYIKLRNLNYAHKCLTMLSLPNVVSYTTLMFAYAKSSQEDEVVKLFSEMRWAGIQPNEFSFVAILTLCSSLLDLQLCSQVHALAIKLDYCGYTYVCNALMGTYIKCGHLDSAISLLEEMPQRDLASWNTVLSGLVKELEYEKAFEFFRGMLRIDGFRVDHISLSTLLVAATESFDYMKGRECHAHALRIGVGLNVTLSNALVEFYTKCGSLKSVVLCNEDHNAFSAHYHNLLNSAVLHDNILVAKAIHASLLKAKEDTQLLNTLIASYVKLRNIEYAHKCFAGLSHPNVVSYTTIMSAYAKSSQEGEVVKLFSEMRWAGIEPNEFSLVAILTLCSRLLDLQLGSQVHALAIKSDYCWYNYVCNALIKTYVKCGHFDSAIALLEDMPERNLASWNTVLSGLVKELEYERAFEFFRSMLRSDGFRLDHVSLSSLLVAATESFDYMKGRECHAHALKIGLGMNVMVCHALTEFYTRCRSLKNVVSPNEDPGALSANYHDLLRRSVLYDDILVAKAIHALILKAEENTQHFNTLITTYIKLRNIDYAHKCFVRLSHPNVVSYTTLMFAYAKSSQEAEAVKLFSEMRCLGIEPNEFSFVAILTVCNRLMDLKLGSQVHALAVKSDYCCYTYVCNALMGAYVKCGHLDMAIALLEEMPQRDLASWNTVLSGLVKKLEYERAFEFFRGMLRSDGFSVDHISIMNLLVASTESFDYMKGRECHAYALKNGFGLNLSVCNALIGFYTKCGSLENVVSLFQRMQDKDVITWVGMVVAFMDFGMVESAVNTFLQMPEKNCIAYNALLAGFGQNGEGLQALKLFQGMLERRMELSEYTLTSILHACAVLSEIEIGKQIHGFVIKFGFGSNPCVEAALLDMCTRCGMMVNATKMFDRWSYKQNYSFALTSMMCGYGRNGEPENAISLFCRKQAEGDVVVDVVAATAALGLCGSLGAHNLGKQIHGYVYKSGFQSDLGVCNATISMYSKCGDMEDAVKCFNLMRKHDIRSWNSLISGYLLYGQGDKALTVWSEMEDKGIEPDSFTFVLLLSAYRHTDSNLLDSCRYLFYSMTNTYGIEPTSEHYTSMVSVLSYWGCYDDAEKLIENMPFEPDESVWRALLDSCRLRSKLKLGRKVAEHLVAMEPQNPSTFILVSNLYAASGRWNCFERIRNEMRAKGLQKYPSRSWLIHDNKIHSFYGRDKSHPASKEIYAGLGELIPRCIKAGYVPDTSFVQHDVDENQKKEFLFYHSAKLAVTYGILYTRTVRVVKNIQLCGDCHTFFKYASSVLGREISFRDTSGFHFFKDGECSCKDYWQ